MIFKKTIPPLQIILSFFISLLALSVSAQTKNITISGTIKEAISNTKIPYANVILKSKDNQILGGTVSNEEGAFAIANIKSGNYF